ncbi:alpha/beta hydrolase [Nocardia sp. NRRL S-836]|uniref:alpha/beta hydrolase n=1 Tax=Nocardia sp. NRRL S-836 TaxID=1519492 RepID=UPI0006AEEA2E|nr:alpha/beta hydrolase [Nocardia sp. NRRL S-836]
MNVLLAFALAAASVTTPVHLPPTAPCPANVPADTSCYEGRDANGAYYTIAVPKHWNKTLVVHSHGGPDLGDPTPERTRDDLNRWAVMVKEGYAWAGTSYRRGGYGTRMAAEDTDNLRKLAGSMLKPRKVYLHGQSWGGNVAAKTIELYRDYDAALLTSGVLAGGSRGYDYRVDLRVVYQYYCGNHPRPSEAQYPLWMGLRKDSTMTTAGLRGRVEECLGTTGNRTAEQQQKLNDILAVTKIPESTLASHLNFATFTFRDIVHNRLGGRNPWSNAGVRYQGSHDDAALNAGVERFSPDPRARAELVHDSDLTGKIDIPVLSVHAIGDPTAFVEHESAYRQQVLKAGRWWNLVQTFTTESEHSALSDSGYASAIQSLERWEKTGLRPSPSSVAARCPRNDATYGTGCFFDPSYRPKPYESRVAPRA